MVVLTLSLTNVYVLLKALNRNGSVETFTPVLQAVKPEVLATTTLIALELRVTEPTRLVLLFSRLEGHSRILIVLLAPLVILLVNRPVFPVWGLLLPAEKFSPRAIVELEVVVEELAEVVAEVAEVVASALELL